MPRWCRQEGKGRAAATGRWCEGVSVMIVTRHGAQAAERAVVELARSLPRHAGLVDATCPKGYVLRVTSPAAPAAGGLPAPPPLHRPRASASIGPAPRGVRAASPRGRPRQPARLAEDRRSRSSRAVRARLASGRVPAIGDPNAARPCSPPGAGAAPRRPTRSLRDAQPGR
jgi:hypothetical protein